MVRPSVFFTFLLGYCLMVPSGCQPIINLGKNPSGEDLQKIETLPNYYDGQFHNLDNLPSGIVAPAGSRGPRWLGLMKYFVGKKPASTRPEQGMPTVQTDLNTSYAQPTVIWFGHSSFLLKAGGANLLFDPNFSSFAGPFSGLINAFPGSNAYDERQMPQLDAVIISHDHYDHLDYLTMKLLKQKAKRVIVPVGIGSHLRKWGYPAEQIIELYWHQSYRINDSVTVTATPAHHRSNRTMAQRKTLWASYVIQSGKQKIYFSGDTGYSSHFQQIGKQYGPFDLAMMECGQYNSRWPHSHMHPSQTARAARDIGAAVIVPVHWAKFAESMHPWNEPVQLLLKAADSLSVSVSVPMIGEPYSIGQAPKQMEWWKGF